MVQSGAEGLPRRAGEYRAMAAREHGPNCGGCGSGSEGSNPEFFSQKGSSQEFFFKGKVPLLLEYYDG